jgi:hypothetical protein
MRPHRTHGNIAQAESPKHYLPQPGQSQTPAWMTRLEKENREKKTRRLQTIEAGTTKTSETMPSFDERGIEPELHSHHTPHFTIGDCDELKKKKQCEDRRDCSWFQNQCWTAGKDTKFMNIQEDMSTTSEEEEMTREEEDVLERFCQKMGCSEGEALDKCETRRNRIRKKGWWGRPYAKTKEEIEFISRRPHSVCENDAKRKFNVFHGATAAAGATAAMLSMAHLLVPRANYASQSSQTANSPDTSKLENIRKMKHKIYEVERAKESILDQMKGHMNKTPVFYKLKPVEQMKADLSKKEAEKNILLKKLKVLEEEVGQ